MNDVDGDGTLDVLLGDVSGVLLFLGPDYRSAERVPLPALLWPGDTWDVSAVAPVDIVDDGDLDLCISSTRWPDGEETVLEDVSTRQTLTVTRED